jgi:hypothetical protein
MSEGQPVAKLAAQNYTFGVISNQLARDLHVDTVTAAALMGCTGCEIN